MNFSLPLQSELLKTKRTASFWLSVIGAGFIPSIFFLAYTLKPEASLRSLKFDPWTFHFFSGWQSLNSFLFPMYIILVCTMIPQIEFRNNAWKQVFASPQTTAQVYFSKFITIQLMILFFYLLFNIFMLLTGITANLLQPSLPFFERQVDWAYLMKLNLKTYISVLGISAIQFWFSLRFRSFAAPVGIGLALLVGALVSSGLGWKHIYKIPYAHPILTLQTSKIPGRPFLENHEINSICYLVFFVVVGYLDLRFRKEKG